MKLTRNEFRFLQRNLTTFKNALEYAIEDSRFAEDYEWNKKEMVLCEGLMQKIMKEANDNLLEGD